jgi:oligopeptide/dipeptide ABC transporter ATP-binding protein
MPVADPRTRDLRRRTLLQGDIPSPIDPPSGCVFRTRCPIATGDCATVVPKLEAAGPGRLKACIRR